MLKIKTKYFIPNIFSFVNDIKEYNLKKLQADIIGALTVAVIALPQSMAYALIAGVHPKYGLYAAIIPVVISSLLGSSRYLIAGPTNAVSMVVYSTIASTMVGGVAISQMPEELKMQMVFLLAFLSGLIQFAMGIARFGNLINFVSHSVIIGFTAGAGFLIGFNQLKNLLGLKIGSFPHFVETLTHLITNLQYTNFPSLFLGIYTIVFVILFKKYLQKWPGLFLAVVSSAIISALFGLDKYGVKFIGEIPRSLPPFSTFSFNFDNAHTLLMPALAVSILAIVEALSIAKSIANTSGEKIDGNREIVAQGITNMVSAFFSGIPGTGSFTRSAVNFKAGSATRFAGVFSGIFVLATLLLLAPYAKFIPMPSLAGILIVIAYSMVDKKGVKFAYKATKSDRAVLLITFLSTIFLELESAIYIGVILSVALFLNKVSRPDFYEVFPRREDRKLISSRENEDYLCPQLSIHQIEGAIFFASTNSLEKSLYDAQGKKVIILRMKYVRIIDATGAHSLEKFIKDCHDKNIRVIFSGMKDRVRKILEDSGAFDHIDKTNIVNDATEAINLAFVKYIDKEICKNCSARIFKEC